MLKNKHFKSKRNHGDGYFLKKLAIDLNLELCDNINIEN